MPFLQKGFSVKTVGLGLVKNMLDALPKNLMDSFTEETRETALAVVREAKRIVPVDTGKLRSNIFVREHAFNDFEIVAATDYASYVEHGTVNMVARPYIRPALYRYSGTYGKKILDRFERKMKRYYR